MATMSHETASPQPSHRFAFRTRVGAMTLTILLAGCPATDETEPGFCTISPSSATVNTGEQVSFSAECSGQITIDERAYVNAAFITRVDEMVWTAPLIPGEYEAVVYVEGDPDARAVATVTVLEEPVSVPTRTVWRVQRGHRHVRLSRDGERLASLSTEGALTVWDPETFDVMGNADQLGVSGFAWHPTDPDVYVMNGIGFADFNWREQHITRTYSVGSLAFANSEYSPDGNHVIAWDAGNVWLDDVATDGHTLALAKPGRDDCYEFPDGEVLCGEALYIAHRRGDPDTGSTGLPIRGAPLYALFSDDSSEVAVAFGDTNVTGTDALVVFDTASGAELRSTVLSDPCPRDQCFSGLFVPHPDGLTMVGYGQVASSRPNLGGLFRVITASLETGQLDSANDPGRLRGSARNILLSPDGRRAAVQTHHLDDGLGLAMYDLVAERYLWSQLEITLEGGSPVRREVPVLEGWFEDERIVVLVEPGATSRQQVLAYMNPDDGAVVQRQIAPNAGVERVRWNPTGTRAYWFATALSNVVRDKLIVYDAAGAFLWSDEVVGADWIASEPDQIVTVVGNVLSWRDATNGDVLRTATLTEEVSSIAISDDQTMVIGWNDVRGGHILQDVMTGERLNDMITGAVLARPYDWTPEGLIFDDSGQAWDPATRTNSTLGVGLGVPEAGTDLLRECFEQCRRGEAICQVQCAAQIRCFAWSPDGQFVAVGEGPDPGVEISRDIYGSPVHQIRVIDITTGDEVGFHHAREQGYTCSMDWHPTENQLLIGSNDLLWNLDVTPSSP